eukprot:6014777-Amphidinium_carterae.1
MQQQMTSFESRLAELESKLLRADGVSNRSIPVGLLASARGEVQTGAKLTPPAGVAGASVSGAQASASASASAGDTVAAVAKGTYYGVGAGKGTSRGAAQSRPKS